MKKTAPKKKPAKKAAKPALLQGWECPACHTIHSPTSTECRCKLVRDIPTEDFIERMKRRREEMEKYEEDQKRWREAARPQHPWVWPNHGPYYPRQDPPFQLPQVWCIQGPQFQ